jgi:nitrogen regulatory protein PII
MKIVVAYVDPERFEQIRIDLLELGYPSLSVISADGSIPEATLSGHYRGADLMQHTRRKARLECVAGDDQVDTVVETVLEAGGEHSFVYVLPVDGAYPADTVKLSAGADALPSP